ncbi:MAG: PadR family transcriptional regulator [Pseudomonadota bacterium]|nr:PadR family transcriptional regulator [Pseudomonadota bacterium]
MNIKILCLGVLSKGPASGYEIFKEFREGPFSHFQNISFGSIYPALKTLNKDGLIAYVPASDQQRVDKNIFRLTDDGRTALAAALMAKPSRTRVHSDALFILCFADRLPHRHVTEVIDDYIREYRDRAELITAADLNECSAGARFVAGYGLAVSRAVLDYMEKNREELIKAVLAETDSDSFGD